MIERYVLDAQQVLDAARGMNPLACGHIASCLLDDGRILAAYGHDTSKDAAMIRWKP